MFGVYLVKREIITAEQVVEALWLQGKKRLPLGKIAVRRGMISVTQAFDVLNARADRDEGASFADVAVDMELLTKENLDEIRAIQQKEQEPIGQILVRMGALTQEQLDECLKEYLRSLC